MEVCAGGEGTVRRIAPGFAWVELDGRIVPAHIRGGLKEGPRDSVHLVAVGDRVRLRPSVGRGILVEEVLPRRSEIARVDPGDPRGLRKHVLAANVDQVCVIVSIHRPRFNPRGVDRFLVLAAAAGVPATVVLNKYDLRDIAEGGTPDPEAECEAYRVLGYEAVATSAVTGKGLDALGRALSGRRTFLLGPSGAGKSTLLNRLYGLELRTQPISRATSKGVHTTARVDWIDLPGGGVVLDSPGIRSIHPWGLRRAALSGCFPEFQTVGPCRFGDCLHRGEAGCAMEVGVEEGRVPRRRLESYRRILESLPG